MRNKSALILGSGHSNSELERTRYGTDKKVAFGATMGWWAKVRSILEFSPYYRALVESAMIHNRKSNLPAGLWQAGLRNIFQ